MRVSIAVALLASTAVAQTVEPDLRLPGPGITGAPQHITAAPARAVPQAMPFMPTRVALHITVSSIPITDLPTEDVDVVEVSVPGGVAPATAVWPTEGNVHFFNEVAGFEYATLPLAGPNVSGVDFYSDGTWGVYPTAAFMHIFRMATPPTGLPTQTVAVPIPDSPMRRDIDPILINHPSSPSGRAVIQATQRTITCFEIPTGNTLWSTVLPTPVVEAVDPVINAANTLLFVPTEGFMRAIDPITGAILSTTALNTQLVRELDARFVLGDTRCYLPTLGVVFAFSGTPPALGGTGALISSTVLNSLVIEGNDMEVDPSGTYGFLPTLALMYQLNLATGAVTTTYPFNGAAHERNQDVVFTPIGVDSAKAVYCTEGTMWIYDVRGLVGAPVTIPLLGDLVDGVDPSFTDTPPAGRIVTVSTDGFTHVVDAVGGFQLGGSPLPTPGSLRIDVDPKPGPVSPGKILQPAIGGLWMLTGFNPSDWIVTVNTGIHVLDLSGPLVDQFVPTNLIYRGGDAQPTTLLGPPEPAYTVDQVDQDFVTKCYEYKSVLNPHPYAWATDAPYYPAWTPYGIYGPPAQVGYDLHGNYLLTLTGLPGGPATEIEVLTHSGYPIQTVPLPSPAIGGFTWDPDNQLVKVGFYDDSEGVYGLGPIANAGPVNANVVYYIDGPRWVPIVDRMNGWQFNPRGLARLGIYDDIDNVSWPDLLCPAPIIRQPVFDEQRKVLAAPLANQTVFFVNAHRLRLGLSVATYSSPDLGAHIAGRLVVDVYSHSTIARLADNRIVVLDNDSGAIRWMSPVLPYAPISPLQTDCYNMTAKGYYRNPTIGDYYELKLNLAPILYGGAVVIDWNPLPGRPYGYPHFYSRYGYEFDLIPPYTIAYSSMLTGASGAVTTPYPMVGDLFVDQVNEYALVRLQGTRLFWIDLFRTVSGLPSSNKVVDLIDYDGYPVAAKEDIAFDSRDKVAVVHLANDQTAWVSGISGNELTRTGGFPDLKRRLFSHPFRGAASYPWYDSSLVQGGLVTFDLTPLRGYIPALAPTYTIVNTSQPPVEASDFSVPWTPLPAGITQQPFQGGSVPGMVFFDVAPGTVEPGCTVRAVNMTRYEQSSMEEPNEGQADGGGAATIAVGCSTGDQVCFTAFDASGNASGQTCVSVTPVAGVPADAADAAVAFSLTSGNPVRDQARFHFSLPRRTTVSLSIYDVSGRRLATLLKGDQTEGDHEVVWSLGHGHRPAAGVYFARFRAGTFESVKKLVVAW